jgi:ATP-dependent Clp protease ATP-binding subunit ClpB
MTSISRARAQDEGARDRRRRILETVRTTFRPEFVNRIDEIVVFDPLGRGDIEAIVDIQVQHLRERLAERKLSLALTDEARAHLAEKGYDPAFGARPLKRLIQRELQDPLALKLLAGEIHEGDEVIVDAGDGDRPRRRGDGRAIAPGPGGSPTPRRVPLDSSP